MPLLRAPGSTWPWLLLCVAWVLAVLAESGPVQWMDSGRYLAAAVQGGWFSEGFGPLEYPLFHTLTALACALAGPSGVSLLNAMLLGPLAGVVYWLARTVAVPHALALAASAATVLAHGVFWEATKVDVFLLPAIWVLLAYALHFDLRVRLGTAQRLAGIGLCLGLAASAHPLGLLVAAPLLPALLQLHRARALWVLVAAIFGFAPAWPAVAAEVASGLGPLEVARHYLSGFSPLQPGSGREGELLRFDLMWHEKNAVTLLLLSLMGPQLFGVLCRPANPRQRLLWWALWVNLLGAASYNVFDRFAYFVPGTALACILGVPRFHGWLARWPAGRALFNASLVAGPLALVSMWLLYSHGLVRLPTHAEGLAYHDDIHYMVVPYLRDTSAADFAAYYEQRAPNGAMIIADETPFGALRAAQAAGQLQGRHLQWCGDSADIGPYVTGAGAYLPRASFCERVVAQYRLSKQPVGFQLLMR